MRFLYCKVADLGLWWNNFLVCKAAVYIMEIKSDENFFSTGFGTDGAI